MISSDGKLLFVVKKNKPLLYPHKVISEGYSTIMRCLVKVIEVET